jgi:hypothetical protein
VEVGIALGDESGEWPGDPVGEFVADVDCSEPESESDGSARGEMALRSVEPPGWSWAEHDSRLMERDRECLGEKGADEDDDDEVEVEVGPPPSISSSEERRLLRVRPAAGGRSLLEGSSRVCQPISTARNSSSYSLTDDDMRRSFTLRASCCTRTNRTWSDVVHDTRDRTHVQSHTRTSIGVISSKLRVGSVATGCETEVMRRPGEANWRDDDELVRLVIVLGGVALGDRGGAFMMADDESEVDISNRRALALRGDIVPNELVRG